MSEWQPIETAPTDVAVLLHSDSLGHVIGRYKKNVDHARDHLSDWVTDWDGDRLARTPSWWQLLPAPPVAKAGEARSSDASSLVSERKG